MEKKKIFDLKTFIYFLCFLGIIAIGWIRIEGNGSLWLAAINAVGICLFPIIVDRYKIESFLKVPYAVYSVIALVGSVVAIKKLAIGQIHYLAIATMIIAIALYGFILIRIIYSFIDKEERKLYLRIRPPFFVVMLFFIFACISVGRVLWTFYFGAVFLCFYIAPLTKEDEERIFASLSQAIVISFFIIQGLALFFRPYDQLRYVGLFNNPNNNAMFYMVFYIGWLSVLSLLRKKSVNKWILRVVFFFASAMWMFLILTMCRSALTGFLLLTAAHFFTEEIIIHKTGINGLSSKVVGMLVMGFFSITIVYSAVRYLPTIIPHEIWLNDYYRDNSEPVRGSDPWNSEKYTEFDEFLEALTGRVDIDNIDAKGQTIITESIFMPVYKSGITEEAPSTEPEVKPPFETIIEDDTVIQYEDGVAPGTDPGHPAYTYEKYSGYEKILGIRKYIYGYYINRLNFEGHTDAYNNIWILNCYQTPHTHNSYLQMAYEFGYVAGGLFLLISILGVLYPFVLSIIKKKETPWYYGVVMMVALGIMGLSLTENMAFPGRLLLSLMFITMLPFAVSATGKATAELAGEPAVKSDEEDHEEIGDKEEINNEDKDVEEASAE